jgi:seryl-tRNA synthetase
VLDLKFIRRNPDAIRTMLDQRRMTAPLNQLLEMDSQWRETVTGVENARNHQNTISKGIAQLKMNKQDASEQIAEMKGLSQELKRLSKQSNVLKQQINEMLLTIPNLPDSSTPVGGSEEDNIEIKRWGNPRTFDFESRPHWELAEELDIVDFGRGTKIAGSNFILFKGLGARLERGLINFMIDLHVSKHGYTEISPPFLANRRTMTGTGQLPKFEEDMYRCDRDEENEDSDLFLIPTAEVPVTNIFAGEILDADDLPIYYVAYTPCFRREAGSYGRETRGLQRLHQFDKVEMVKFTLPEKSYDEHEALLRDAEDILQALGLPYRVIQHCSVELSFAAAKCYDLELWSPVDQKFNLEISSCSNYESFQARRANIRFRRQPHAKTEFVHTLNASGTALPRLVIAILENYQQEDGTIQIPELLKPYMGGIDLITSDSISE